MPTLKLSAHEKSYMDSMSSFPREVIIEKIKQYRKKRADLVALCDSKGLTGQDKAIMVDFFHNHAMNGDLQGSATTVFAKYHRFLSVVNKHLIKESD